MVEQLTNAGLNSVADAPATYEEETYVEGVRQLAGIIEEQRTANWAAVSNVLRDCAATIESLANQSAAGSKDAEIERLRERVKALEEGVRTIAGNNWRDQSKARSFARALLADGGSDA